MALPTPECVAGDYDQRQQFAAIYQGLYEYAEAQAFDVTGLPTVECVNAMMQREILAAIYAVVYLLNT